MYIVGLTGGIGSGKTAVSDRFQAKEITIVDADICARVVVEPGRPALQSIKEHFGDDILEANGATILLDCGLFQGRREEENANKEAFEFDVSRIDAVVLSHAHLDHSGRIPKLVAEAYEGPLYMTLPTCELLEVMLRDAASLQERDAEWENKRRKRAGKEKEEGREAAEKGPGQE